MRLKCNGDKARKARQTEGNIRLQREVAGRVRRCLLLRWEDQKDLCPVLGLSEASICRYFNGERRMSFEMLLKLAGYLGVSAGYLLGEEGLSEEQLEYKVNRMKRLTEDDVAALEEEKAARRRRGRELEEARMEPFDSNDLDKLCECFERIIDGEADLSDVVQATRGSCSGPSVYRWFHTYLLEGRKGIEIMRRRLRCGRKPKNSVDKSESE